MSDIYEWLEAHADALDEVARSSSLDLGLVYMMATFVLTGLDDEEIDAQLFVTGSRSAEIPDALHVLLARFARSASSLSKVVGSRSPDPATRPRPRVVDRAGDLQGVPNRVVALLLLALPARANDPRYAAGPLDRGSWPSPWDLVPCSRYRAGHTMDLVPSVSLQEVEVGALRTLAGSGTRPVSKGA